MESRDLIKAGPTSAAPDTLDDDAGQPVLNYHYFTNLSCYIFPEKKGEKLGRWFNLPLDDVELVTFIKEYYIKVRQIFQGYQVHMIIPLGGNP